jgi:hypothetical protein
MFVATAPALAAGSNMPWEQPLQQILQSIEGPITKIIAVIIIIVTGLSLAFGDAGGGFQGGNRCVGANGSPFLPDHPSAFTRPSPSLVCCSDFKGGSKARRSAALPPLRR